MNTYAQFKTDENLEKDGIILDLGSAGKFKLARAGGANAMFTKELQRAAKPFRRAIVAESLNPEDADRIQIPVFIKTVLLGWEGVTGPDGQPLTFNHENATKLLTDLPELFAEIRKAASDASLYRKEILEAQAGNS